MALTLKGAARLPRGIFNMQVKTCLGMSKWGYLRLYTREPPGYWTGMPGSGMIYRYLFCTPSFEGAIIGFSADLP
jgi:hypothetical protein